MAPRPVILALANPTPEILPEVKAVRARRHHLPPAVPTTRTRSTTCCAFPFIFRRPDVGATTITEEMKIAAVKAIAELAPPNSRMSSPRLTAKVSGTRPEYLIPIQNPSTRA